MRGSVDRLERAAHIQRRGDTSVSRVVGRCVAHTEGDSPRPAGRHAWANDDRRGALWHKLATRHMVFCYRPPGTSDSVPASYGFVGGVLTSDGIGVPARDALVYVNVSVPMGINTLIFGSVTV